MSKRSARKAAVRANTPWVVYALAAALLIVVALLLFNIFQPPPRDPSTLRWDAPPAMEIDVTKNYQATLNTAKGDIVIQLLPQSAPVTVNNFVFLAREGYYDGVTFHRVLDNFMAQTGDPTGTGSGGPGYTFQDEFDPSLTFDGPGVVAMANSGPNSNGSQFFITFAPATHLNGAHTIFGRVIAGMDVANALTRRDPNTNPTFTGDVINTITITEQ